MDTIEIAKLIAPINGKVFAYDEIPLSEKINDETYFVIFNNAPITRNGHWILISIFNNKPGQDNTVYYLDSLGIFPTLKNVIKFLNLNTTGKLVCNKLQLQAETSDFCGQYSVLCMYHLSQGKSFDSLIGQFCSPTPEENDKKVEKLFGAFLTAIKTRESASQALH